MVNFHYMFADKKISSLCIFCHKITSLAHRHNEAGRSRQTERNEFPGRHSLFSVPFPCPAVQCFAVPAARNGLLSIAFH